MIRTPIFEILIATHNPGKICEVRAALQFLPVKLRYLHEFADVSAVTEVGQTYEQNAALKALGYAKQTGVFALADDSGLEVEALDGKPGVFSARFGGEHASDRDRIEQLLAALSQDGSSDRSARFVCCLALAGWQATQEQVGGGEPKLFTVAEARCQGSIAPLARGTNGFGFDPVFVPAGYDRTFAELPIQVKARISHRAQALAAIRTFLEGELTQT